MMQWESDQSVIRPRCGDFQHQHHKQPHQVLHENTATIHRVDSNETNRKHSRATITYNTPRATSPTTPSPRPPPRTNAKTSTKGHHQTVPHDITTPRQSPRPATLQQPSLHNKKSDHHHQLTTNTTNTIATFHHHHQQQQQRQHPTTTATIANSNNNSRHHHHPQLLLKNLTSRCAALLLPSSTAP